ncbi:Uncharacterised protein [Clostridium putrefaciens]|uniref:Lipoprotein n=1 Tax=Clostridium putrefaciens TaxID=99675 RepID=A0A381J8J9_9CLOT|nr:hypothetical protein [Clostridium putrefaciens]SUY47590.1 Uncharacterised protein [Clostridium putrefaciens]
MKSIIRKLIITGILAISLAGCTNIGTKKDTKDSIFYLNPVNTEEFYALDSKGEKKKVANNISNVMYSKGLNKYIGINKDKSLIAIDKDEVIDEIDTFVLYIDEMTKDSTTIYYINEDGELYEREKASTENIRIAKNVMEYKYLGKNAICYRTKDLNLYIKKEGKERLKVASKVSHFKISEDLKKVIYISSQNLYIEDIDKETKEEILTGGSKLLEAEFIRNKDLVYIINNESEESGGKLYYKPYEGKAEEISEEVIGMKLLPSGRGVYYLDAKRKLYFKEFKTKESVELSENVMFLKNSTDSDAYIIDMDRNLKKVSVKGDEEEELLKDVNHSIAYKNKVVAKSSENILYVNSEEVDSNVDVFYVNGKEIVYLKTSGEILVKTYKDKPKVVIEDYKIYKDIYFLDTKVYTNLFTIKDLEGYWVNKDNKDIMMSFSEDTFSEVTPYYFWKYSMKVDTSKFNEIKISLGNMEFNKKTFNKRDENTIDDFTAVYKRVNKDVYVDYETKMKNIKDCAAKILGEEAACANVMERDGHKYYVYVNNINNPYYPIVIDENIKVYKYDDFIKAKELIPIN